MVLKTYFTLPLIFSNQFQNILSWLGKNDIEDIFSDIFYDKSLSWATVQRKSNFYSSRRKEWMVTL